MTAGDWLVLLGHFLLLSLLSVGGAITVASDMHRVMVEQMHLITDAEFSASIAIAQALCTMTKPTAATRISSPAIAINEAAEAARPMI